MLSRALWGVVIAAVVVVLARRARALSADGSVTAFVIGTLAIAVSWTWGALLVAYFGSSSALSRFGAAEKEARTASVVEKGGARDAVQVLANGVGFALASALALVPHVAATSDHAMRLAAFAAGSLAASASDTWATEIGTLWGGTPRSIIGLRPLPTGSSGGVTLVGTSAALLGAAFVALTAFVLHWPPRVCVAAFAGGVAGSTIDSLLGATVQTCRWCDTCERATERAVHDCGTRSRAGGGIPWLGNDTVNLVSGLAGGLVASVLAK